ncbi:T9SS type A sorting domain-containing protein [uncultured Winogradskyella sp.]|uniref:T9SS type A sorting domain-containing protein n=1 Tax=uncultured Winogradskyella sp. TaxID=395353 RepID=UPI0026346359|nr:T9SS type A sorting domain-containing protein [uncultured Winogradskyella sp.]
MNGNIDVGFTRTFDFHYTEIDPMNFNGAFSTATTLTPSTGNYLRSIVSDNNQFIVENSTGWLVFDESNNTTALNHNLPNYNAIVTKKANVSDSDNGILTLVHKGFDAAFNYLVYKTICDIPNATCSAPEQILTEDRDLTKNTSFGAKSGLQVPNFRVLAVSSAEPPATGKVINVIPHASSTATSPFVMPVALATDPIVDPIPLDMPSNADDDFGFFIINDITEAVFITLDAFGNAVEDICPILVDEIEASSIEITTSQGANIANALMAFIQFQESEKTIGAEIVRPDSNNPSTIETIEVLGAKLTNDLPDDLSIRKIEALQTSSTTIVLSILTNYGLLIKNGIDISSLLLDTEDISQNSQSTFIYPNPSTDLVSFSDERITSIEVYDLKGRKILNSKGYSISIIALPKAIYLVKGISVDGIEVIRKLIKN